MKAPCPGCKTPVDVADLPGYSQTKQMAGKWCPVCQHPLDVETAKRETLDYGPSSAEIHANRMKAAEEFVAACGKKEKP